MSGLKNNTNSGSVTSRFTSWLDAMTLRTRRRPETNSSENMCVSSWASLYHAAREARNNLVAASRAAADKLAVPLRGDTKIVMGHGDEPEDILTWEGMTPAKAMAAGAVAGMTEHICTFPIDTVKTRMHAVTSSGQPVYKNAVQGLYQIAKAEGPRSLYRGLPVAALGAAPSHAAHFAAYEAVKKRFGIERGSHSPIVSALAGISATLAHDAISTPMDVVKQRLQVYRSHYRGVWNCISTMIRQEGAIAFYASYPTTVLVNVPYQAVHFVTYEALQTVIHGSTWDDTPLADISAGGLAGAIGGLASNPLDVVRTQVQTQVVPTGSGARRLSPWEITQRIWVEEGLRGFMRGYTARILLFAPSAGICWGIYEAMKRALVPGYRKHPHHPHAEK